MTSSTTITLNGVANFTVEARIFDSLDEAHESGLFYDSDTATPDTISTYHTAVVTLWAIPPEVSP